MNSILIIRTDILSTLIVFFLIVYDRYCARFREGDHYFLGVAIGCLGHDIMALITEITVNSDTVPKVVNDGAHILFFAFSVLFSVKYFHYALSLVVLKKTLKKFRIASDVLFVALLVVLIVSPIEYVQGLDTKYSAGIGPTICYMTGFVLFTAVSLCLRNAVSYDRAVRHAVTHEFAYQFRCYFKDISLEKRFFQSYCHYHTLSCFSSSASGFTNAVL